MKKNIRAPVVIGEESTQILVISDTIVFNIPVFEILEEKYNIKIADCSISTGKIVFNGTVKKTIIYKELPDNYNEGAVRYHEEDYNFGGYVEIEAVTEDICKIEKTGVVNHGFFTPRTFDSSGNILTATDKFIIEIYFKVFREQQINVCCSEETVS